jgi:hypothetical protein
VNGVTDPAPPPTPPPVNPSCKPITAPLAVWLIVQLLALALATARLPLSANFAKPGKALAVEEILVAQFAVSAMMFPFLLRDARSCLALILTAAPMLQLAGVLSETSIARIVGAWTCLAIWLAALALWRAVLPPRHRPVAVAIASLPTLGGLIYWYIASEFANTASFARFLPPVATLRFAQGVEHVSLPLASTAFPAVLGVVAVLLTRRCARRGA